MKKILGISCFYHDSSVALVVNSKIIAATQEERFIRDKHIPDFPIQSIKYCLEEVGLTY
jgi:carbamoyltransferase